jgi:hypothetical protein
MNTELQKLKKNDLLKIISKMKKIDLIKVINNKIGGNDQNIINETNNAIRKPLSINNSINPNDLKKLNSTSYTNNSMANDSQYNTIYKKNNNKLNKNKNNNKLNKNK